MTDRLEGRLAGLTAGTPDAGAAAARFADRAAEAELVDVAYTTMDSPIGPLLAAATPRGVVKIAFAAHENADAVLEHLAARVSPRILERPAALDGVRRELDEYFAGARREFGVGLDRRLMTPFQRRVLDRTYAIPYGQRSTYAEVAAAAGNPRASRAAGNALAANPIPVIVPCHRVLRTGGHLGGYAGGLDRKELLLRLESTGT
jgi:methylated-DNA-[protein]-cysteine S-methyltransferase